MSIRQDINTALKGLYKKAQPGFMMPTGNEQIDAASNLANVHIQRGIARGIKNMIPGIVDGLVGVPAGLINGLGSGIGDMLSGGSFTKGFGEGWDDSTSFVKNYYSDPIRRAEMAVGGNVVKSMLSGAQNYYQDALARNIAPGKYNDYLHELAVMDSVEKGVSTATELGLTLPVYGKLLGAGFGALAKGRKTVPAVRLAAQVKPASGLVRKASKLVGQAAQAEFVPHAGFNAGMKAYNQNLDRLITDELTRRAQQAEKDRLRVGPTQARADELAQRQHDWWAWNP